jgi:hypothetical protein
VTTNVVALTNVETLKLSRMLDGECSSLWLPSNVRVSTNVELARCSKVDVTTNAEVMTNADGDDEAVGENIGETNLSFTKVVTTRKV